MQPGALSVAGRGRSRRSRLASSACLAESLGPNLDSVPKPSPLKEPPPGRPRKPFRSSASHLPWPFPIARGTLPLPQPSLTCIQPLPGPSTSPSSRKTVRAKREWASAAIQSWQPRPPPPPLSQLPAPGAAQDSAFSGDRVTLLLLGNSELIQPSHIFRRQKLRPSSRYTELLQSNFPCFFPCPVQVPRHGKERRFCLSRWGWSSEEGACWTAVWPCWAALGCKLKEAVFIKHLANAGHISGPSTAPSISCPFHKYLQIIRHSPGTCSKHERCGD